MAKRLVLLVIALWAALYIVLRLIGALFDLAGAAVAEHGWTIALAMALLMLAAAWLVGRWRGLDGRRLLLTCVVALLASYTLVVATESALSAVALRVPLDQVAFTIAYRLLVAVEVVAMSWLVSSLAIRQGVRRVPGPDITGNPGVDSD